MAGIPYSNTVVGRWTFIWVTRWNNSSASGTWLRWRRWFRKSDFYYVLLIPATTKHQKKPKQKLVLAAIPMRQEHSSTPSKPPPKSRVTTAYWYFLICMWFQGSLSVRSGFTLHHLQLPLLCIKGTRFTVTCNASMTCFQVFEPVYVTLLSRTFNNTGIHDFNCCRSVSIKSVIYSSHAL